MYEKFYTTGTPSPIEVKALHYKADVSNQDEVMAFLREHTHGYAFTLVGDKIYTKRPFKPSDQIYPDTMVAVYPDNKFNSMGVTTFNSLFAPLPSGGKYCANDDEGVVEAYYFSADRSNVDDVLTFLRKYYAPFLTQTDHADTKAKLNCIAVPYKPGSIAYFYPGRVITVTKRADFPFSSHALEDFQKYYSPYIEPTPTVRDTAFYQTDEAPTRTVEVMLYYSDRSNRAEVEAFINSRLAGLCPWGDSYTHHAGARYELIAISVPGKKTLYLSPGMAVGIFTDSKEVDCHPVNYFDNYFTRTNHPTEKETTVENDNPTLRYLQKPNETEYKISGLETPETDYTKNRNKVYDALAVLRNNASDPHFENVTTELMDLLSDAYNEGFDFGMTAAQTNPYVDWK